MKYETRPATPETTVQRIVYAVAAFDDTDPVDLPPLYHTIEPDSLARCIEYITAGKIHFQYAGAHVTVESDGTVDVTEDSVETPLQAESATSD